MQHSPHFMTLNFSLIDSILIILGRCFFQFLSQKFFRAKSNFLKPFPKIVIKMLLFTYFDEIRHETPSLSVYPQKTKYSPNLMSLILEYFPALIECLKLMLMHDFRVSEIITIRNMKIN